MTTDDKDLDLRRQARLYSGGFNVPLKDGNGDSTTTLISANGFPTLNLRSKKVADFLASSSWQVAAQKWPDRTIPCSRRQKIGKLLGAVRCLALDALAGAVKSQSKALVDGEFWLLIM